MKNFEALGVDSKIMKAIGELGFDRPTEVQEQAIPFIINETSDLVALAQTGTGKTAAFGLPLIQMIDGGFRDTQALILCPTRELCLQITRDLKAFSKYKGNINVVAIYGGASIENQIKEVKRGAHVIVGTPGRMIDMIQRKKINLENVNWVVLDEADEMLNMGFQEDLNKILAETPGEKRTLLFSATMPSEVARIARKYMSAPQEITVGKKNEAAKNISHEYYVAHARDRYLALKRIVDYNPEIFGIIFCRTKIETQQVASSLIKDGYNADALHGDLSQGQRDHVMKRFRNRTLQMLVATDVAARGIDVDDVTHVINYNLPDEIENYTHRSGRTARAGKSGVSIAIVNMKEIGKIRMIERIIGHKFTKQLIPNGFDVCERQLFSLVSKIHNTSVNEKEIAEYLPKIYEELKELSKEELIKRFVSDEFNRFLEYYRNAPDLNVEARRDDSRSARKGRQRMFVNLGHLDGLDKRELRDYICEMTNMDHSALLDVDVKNSYSFIEAKNEQAELILVAFRKQFYRGRPVKIELTSGRRSGGDRKQGGGGKYGRKKDYGNKKKYSRRENSSHNKREEGNSGFKESFKKKRPRKRK